MDKHQKALGEMPINKLLTKMAAPAIVGMLANSLYNVVDTIFLGQGVGTIAIAGVTIALPMQMLIMAISFLVGVGAASVISRRLGEKNTELAHQAAGNAITSILVTSTILTILALIFIDPLLIFFGATEGILPYARDYLAIVLLGSPFFGFSIVANNIIRSEGNAKVAMISMLIGLGLNIILDPIFIFGLHLGIKGAAIATAISQIIAFMYVLNYFISKKTSLILEKKHFKINLNIQKEIIALGSSSFLRQITFIILAIAIQNSLKLYGGDIYIAVYGIINKIQMFVMLPPFGLTQAYQPIVGYNYGAKKYNRIIEVNRKTLKISTIYCTVFFVIMMLFPAQIISIFTPDSEAIRLGTIALQLNILFFPLFGFQMIGATYFLAVGKAWTALFLTLSRQVIILIPLVLILPIFFQANGIWYSFPIADGSAILIVFFFLRKELKRLNELKHINPTSH